MESRFESLWIGTSGQTQYPQLKEETEADVVIVGGGIAGLMAAYFLTLEGKKVIVVEAQRLACGTTGYTTAKVTILHDLKYAFLKKNFGIEKAKIYADSHMCAIQDFEDIVNKEQIACEFHRSNAFLYTNENGSKNKIKDEYEALSMMGFPVTYIESDSAFPVPFISALKIPNQALFHPRKFLLALAEKMQKHGCQIYEQSRVEKISDGTPCIVKTANGLIRAKDVIVATNYPILNDDFIFARLSQMRSYALAFQTAKDFSRDMYIGVGKHEVTIRTHEEGNKQWVIIGGEDHPSGETQKTDEKYQQLLHTTHQQFAFESIEYQWSAQDAAAIDQVPLIGKLPSAKHLYITTGYGEWGMTTSVVSARLLTSLILQKEHPWQELYDPSRLNVKAALQKSVEVSEQIIKGYGAHILPHDTDVGKLKPGEGKIIKKNGDILAVHRSEAGKLCALSAVCTHMGCIVDWNKAEQTWDCPCHGSRFASEGEVIHGPAIQPLEKKSI